MKSYIVVGGGILGASTVYHLARAGANVTLIDRYDKGQATDAAAGIVCPWLSQRRNQKWYRLAKNGAKYYETLIPRLGQDGEYDTGYKKVGAISIHTDDVKLDKMQERAYVKREDAAEIGDIVRLTKEETKEKFPALDDEYASVFISGAARVSGRALRDALIRAAKKHGASVVKGDATLLNEANKVVGADVNGKKYTADCTIVTAGAWANELLHPLGLSFQVSFQKAQILHLQKEELETDQLPVVMPPNDQYILAFDKGRMVVGATHENDTGFDLRATAGGMQEVLNKALQVAPLLSDSTVLETRVGFRPFTPGFLPIIGQVPGLEGVLIANGLGASGLTVGPYLGAQLAKLALGQEIEINLEDYPVSGAIES